MNPLREILLRIIGHSSGLMAGDKVFDTTEALVIAEYAEKEIREYFEEATKELVKLKEWNEHLRNHLNLAETVIMHYYGNTSGTPSMAVDYVIHQIKMEKMKGVSGGGGAS